MMTAWTALLLLTVATNPVPDNATTQTAQQLSAARPAAHQMIILDEHGNTVSLANVRSRH